MGHETYHPIHQGFDQQIGVSNFGHPKSYYPPYFRNSKTFANETEQYLTDKLTDETVSFIENYKRDQPFMISMWYYNVHGPHVGRKDFVEHFEAKGLTGKQAHYAAMVKSVDESVGRIRKALKEKGVENETMIVLLSDQGSLFEIEELRGSKRVDTLGEGGSRVPFFVYWPGVTKPDSKNQSIIQSTDLFPTFVEIAGGDPAKVKDLDGVSLVSTIKNNSTLARNKPVFAYRAYQDLYASVRTGDFKLFAYRSGKTELYNVIEDVKEDHDISNSNPHKTKELINELIEWEKEMGVEEFSGVQ